MPKLTDAQRVILSTAVERNDRAILPLPKSIRMNKGSATTVLKSLLKQGWDWDGDELVKRPAISAGK